MNTSEGNKLIADFMNLARDDTDKDFGPGYIVNDYKISDRFIIKTDVQYCSPEELPYHLSYDWLMPVVERCRKIWNKYDFESEENILFESEIFNLDNTLSDFLNGDIDAIYRRVISFIKWYNENYLNE